MASGRRFVGASARALIAAADASNISDAIIRRVEALLADAGVQEPPVDLPLIASLMGVRQIHFVSMRSAGRLIPDGPSYVMQVNASHSFGKRNFTVGHEIAHLMLRDCSVERAHVEDRITGSFEAGSEEELLCDLVACELLMPTRMFTPQAEGLGFNLDTLSGLARLFGASREATARRMVESGLWPCAMAVWHLSHKPTQRPLIDQPSLPIPGLNDAQPVREVRVRYAVHSPSFPHHLHPHLAAVPDGVIHRCFVQGSKVCGTELLDIGSKPVSAYVMATAFQAPDADIAAREVLTLVLSVCRNDPDGGQLALWTD